MNKNKRQLLSTTAIAVLLTVAMTVASLCGTLPLVGAQPKTRELTVKTGAFLTVNPNPVGLGQSVQVTFWVEPSQPLYTEKFSGYEVTIIHPDGTVETKGPFTSLGRQTIQFFTYKPTSVGNYTFKFKYPGQKFSSTNDTYLPATAEDVILKVQEEPIPDYPLNPLPTSYWTRPINAQNKNWAAISGNWLFRGGTTAHK